VSNIHGEMAHAPVTLAVYAAMRAAIMEHSTFDVRTREAIALTVAAVNKCEYCAGAHTAGALALGWSLEQVAAFWSGNVDFDSRLAGLLSLAVEIATGGGFVDDSTWNACLDSGWSTEQLTDCSPTSP